MSAFLGLRSWIRAVLWLLFVGLVVYVLIRLFSTARSGIGGAILSSTLAILVAVVPIVVAHYQQRRQEFQAQQREQNVKTYEAFTGYIYDDILRPILDARERGETYEASSQEIQKQRVKMREFVKSVTLWGGDEVVVALSSFRAVLIESKKPGWTKADKDIWGDIAFHETARLFLALRRDLGYDNKGVTPNHLWSFFGVDPGTVPPTPPQWPSKVVGGSSVEKAQE